MFGPQVESGSEPEDDSQMKFYTEQHRGRRRNKGERKGTRVVNVEFVGGGGGGRGHEAKEFLPTFSGMWADKQE